MVVFTLYLPVILIWCTLLKLIHKGDNILLLLHVVTLVWHKNVWFHTKMPSLSQKCPVWHNNALNQWQFWWLENFEKSIIWKYHWIINLISKIMQKKCRKLQTYVEKLTEGTCVPNFRDYSRFFLISILLTFGHNVDQSNPIPMKCNLRVSCHLLNAYTKFEIAIAMHIQKKVTEKMHMNRKTLAYHNSTIF